MPAIAATFRLDQATRFYRAPMGKKVAMAVSGLVLFGFVVGHMLGNLQIYLGRARINAYAHSLREIPVLLWGIRALLFVCVVVHIISAVQLTALKMEARPTRYARHEPVVSSYASRTMMWSGPILLAFIIYHLLHLTFGTVHPNFIELDVFDNVINGFRVVPASIAYIIGMVALGLHLRHGIWSMFQSVGISHPRYTPWLKAFATVMTAIIVVGNISIPVSVMAGFIHE
jgi:succinate dehydrogenase / fumarate reductase, cytochrome b subunit